jgi:hypothetical protein
VAIHYSAGARIPASHSAQRLSTPHCDCRRASFPQSKSRNSNPLAERRKEHHTQNKNAARGNISSIPLPEEHCWISRRKNLKTPTAGAQWIKTLTQNNSRCINHNAE